MNLFSLYIIGSLVVGVLGHRRRGGFLFFAILSGVTHPLFGAVVLFLSGPTTEDAYYRKRGLRKKLRPGEKRPWFRWSRKQIADQRTQLPKKRYLIHSRAK